MMFNQNHNMRSFLSIGIARLKEMEQITEGRLLILKTEWKKTISMPRKMKKRRRKELELDNRILRYGQYLLKPFANWNI